MPDGMLGDNKALRRILNGPLTGLLERLNGEEGPEWERALSRFLRRENPWEVRKLLEFVDWFTTRYGTDFDPVSCFKVDESPEALVAIRTISSEAQAYFDSAAKNSLLVRSGVQRVTIHRLLFASRGTPLIKELDAQRYRQRVCLFGVWQMLREQPHAGKGSLHTNDTGEFAENVFLVEDATRTQRFLQLWNPPGRPCWDIDLKPLSYSDRFRRGTRVFTTTL